MPRGQPDYGMYQQKTVGATLADMADLAVRLGSIVEYDRRGDIILLDDFESPVLKWYVATAGTATVTLDSTNVKSGAQAIKLSTDAAFGGRIKIYKYRYALASKRIGLELHFSRPKPTYFLHLEIQHWTGTINYFAYLTIHLDLGTLRVTTLGGPAYEIAAGLAFPDLAHTYIPVKLVVDFGTGKYVRALLGDIEYDLSAFNIESNPDLVTTKRALAGFELWNDITATAADLWIDDVIVTMNEP